MNQFHSLGLSSSLLSTLDRLSFSEPTAIQLETIPHALAGKHILGSAPTGSGKTAAFSIPMVEWLLKNPEGHALILTPTRELASQVLKFVQQLIAGQKIKAALLIGGNSMYLQRKQLQEKPRIIIGTPGRINDHLNQRTLKLDKVGYLVLDETDRMLDMGFREQIQTILEGMPERPQTLLFSATLPKHIQNLTQTYLTDPVRVSVGSTHVPVDRIKQTTVNVSEREKYHVLKEHIAPIQGSIIIFAKTKIGCDELADELHADQISARALHGDLNQRARTRIVDMFRNQKFKVLVATDVAARGLDISHIECVINFDLPQSPEDYIHRIGRTGRAGAEGTAINLVSPMDIPKWRAICRLIQSGISSPASHPSQKGRKGGGFGARSQHHSERRFGRSEHNPRERRSSGFESSQNAHERRSPRFEGRHTDAPRERRFENQDASHERRSPRFEGRSHDASREHRPYGEHGSEGRYAPRDRFARSEPSTSRAPRSGSAFKTQRHTESKHTPEVRSERPFSYADSPRTQRGPGRFGRSSEQTTMKKPFKKRQPATV